MARRSKMLSILAASMLLLAACGDRDTSANKEDATKVKEQTSDEKTAATTEDTNTEESSNNTTATQQEEATTTDADEANSEQQQEQEQQQKQETSSKEQASTTEKADTDTYTNADTDATTKSSTKEDSSQSTSNKVTTSKAAEDEKKVAAVNLVHRDFLQNQMKTAKNGMTEGVPFASGESVFEDVTNAWGEPDTKFSNETNYIEYKKNGVVTYALAIGRGDRVYDIRTFVAPDDSFKLTDISFEDIKTVLGTPKSVTTSGSDTILNYAAGNNTLKFVGSTSAQKLNHISIFNEKSSEPMGGRN